jgi:hypothetical protein
LGVVVLLSPIVVPAAGAADFPIVIRTYDASGLPEGDRGAALAAASAILENAGLVVARLACDDVESGGTDHPCHRPLRADELSLRFVRLPIDGPAKAGHYRRRGARHATLGYSLLETGGRFGSLATVYVDRIAHLAEASEIDLPTLLGRAIAHEIGHLLLGTAAHARVGVMRPLWSSDALRRSTTRDWRFTPADAEALRTAARQRAEHVPGGL